jgi:ATP-NAD kinase N-terminal domain
VTVGGDGTLLRGVRVAAPIGGVVLGVNVGRVGFLTEVGPDDIVAALDAVHAGRYSVDARLTLTMRASRPLEIPAGMDALLRFGRGSALPSPRVRPGTAEQVGWGVPLDVLALNDIVVEKVARDRQASLAVYVSGRLFASYSADALIVASSTGSTTGPENLTFNQIAERLVAASGTPAAIMHIPRPVLRAMSVLTRPILPAFARQTRAAVVMDTTDMTAAPMGGPDAAHTTLDDVLRDEALPTGR